MKIVVLDGYTLNPGDLSWDDLRALGECQIHDRTPPEQIHSRAAGAAIVLTNKTPLDAGTIDTLPDLRYIGVLATGYNIVDVEAARRRNVAVCNIPTYGTPSVAQMTFAHLLELTQHVGDHSAGVRAGRWSASKDWCYWEHPMIELAGLTMGIVGFGRIGQAVGKLADAFGMRVLASDAAPPPNPPPYARMVELDQLFSESDVVSLHCPLTPQTQHLVNARRLRLMKPTAFLINTSRGPLVNETDLADALNAGRIAGAGLDVLSVEPPPRDNPLLSARNCIITPHIAWATRSARQRLLDTAVENVRAFLRGRPANLV
jgi:glycerate dehydrogenase